VPGAFVLLSVNEAGLEAGNAGFVLGKTTPLLQDTAATDAWGLWQVEYRDVVVLDAEGRRRSVQNLTTNDLSVTANFAALKQLLLDAR
jgi:predicted transcriptional regulator